MLQCPVGEIATKKRRRSSKKLAPVQTQVDIAVLQRDWAALAAPIAARTLVRAPCSAQGASKESHPHSTHN